MKQAVKAKFDSYPRHIRQKLEVLRSLIYEVASQTEGVGKIEETLKWGQPAYLTSESKSGTTIRIDWTEKNPEQYALYVHCNTSLVNSYQARFPGTFKFDGNRAILFSVSEAIPDEAVKACIKMALTYHKRKAQT